LQEAEVSWLLAAEARLPLSCHLAHILAHTLIRLLFFLLLLLLQEAEVSRLSAVEAAAERLRVQLAAADAAVGDKDSTLSLLLADKAYLSKEVQVSLETQH
jgi:hypothetical protein